ncbi:outer membrane protein transport protein, partial [Pseudomonas sp.]|uniref:OmpP1/FadL family transporter n=1 Tax=Pseudomonas sp. TaxID=306 RepID=UPI00235402C2
TLRTEPSNSALAYSFNIPSSPSIEAAQMGGASIAFPQSSMIASDNPAGMSYIGNRSDFGLEVFSGTFNSTFGSETNKNDFKTTVPLPSGGFNFDIDDKLSLGMSIYPIGSGVWYPNAVVPGLGLPKAKSKISFVNFAPTIAYKITPDFSVGLSAILSVQQLQMRGLAVPQANGGLAEVPTHGTSTAFGYGARAGFLWNLNSMFSFGGSYSPKVKFSDAKGYKDDVLATADGHLDLPAQAGLGMAVHLTPELTVAADYVRIQWSDVAFLNDPNGNGLNSQSVYRLGLAWNASPSLTLRAGFNRASSAVDSNHTAGNYFSPGIMNKSISTGLTYKLSNQLDLSLGYEYGFTNKIKGTGLSQGTNPEAGFNQVLFGMGYHF